MSALPLTAIEARILGVLIEKKHTVPDTYPLSLNALQSGCNQKSSRDPVMELSEPELLEALDTLRQKSLIAESSGGRVSKYAHNLDRVLSIPSQSVAILTVLILRGPLTTAEIRQYTERLHRFSDVSAVEGFLSELQERTDGALVVELPRQSGARERRWAHLLCGEPQISESATSATGSSNLEARVSVLEAEVAELKALLESLTAG
ncbi:YceH family protein [Leeia sp. TBRC 13508]|uniref:YceH family protein n=1 Tax=Leeia speluncae TaxID=2884804 RepID=A0ABS8DAR8_9NEIS|nr:YceH family protein [Leeia speluncae]MCB6185222.1 YceH family protein [Leeia speluncae]